MKLGNTKGEKDIRRPLCLRFKPELLRLGHCYLGVIYKVITLIIPLIPEIEELPMYQEPQPQVNDQFPILISPEVSDSNSNS